MKKFKNFALFAVVFAVLFSFMSPAKALNIVNDGVILTDDNQRFIVGLSDAELQKFTWLKLRADDSNHTIVYCADRNVSWPNDGESGISYNSEIDSMDPGLIYILQRYPSPSNEERYVTQGAIWLYQDAKQNGYSQASTFPGVTDANDPHGVIQKMRSLATAALNISSSDINSGNGTIGDLSVIDNSSMTLSSDKDYYISDLLPAFVSGVATYAVSVSGVDGAVVIPQSGSDVSAIPASQGFYVKVPYSNGQNINKTVTVSVTIQTSAQFISPVGTTGTYQRVIGLFSDTKPVTKTFKLKTAETVCVDYVIVGNTIPDPALTDPTPEKKCYEKGINYNQEKELTTRTKCVFKGWNTSRDLTGKWVDGTALNNDMTLYGAWDCPTVIVPPTAAQAPFIVLGIALIGAAGFVGYRVYNKKH